MATKLSTVIAATPATDLAVVQAMAEQLDSYILRGEVYRTIALRTPLHGEERMQSGGGDLLARLHKLSAQSDALSSAQKQALADAKAKIEETTGRLRVPYQALLLREAKARLNSLKWFLDDCQENRRECRVQYPFEIRNRQRVAEIGKALDAEGIELRATVGRDPVELRATVGRDPAARSALIARQRRVAADVTAQLTAIDQRLRALTGGSEFVWDASVAHIYPRSEYWYLYALPLGSAT